MTNFNGDCIVLFVFGGTQVITREYVNNCLLFVLSFRYGTIISTKAILDKTTNKCKGKLAFRSFPGTIVNLSPFFTPTYTGYGFVDFESPTCAENAVKGLQSKGIQAQMAKVGIWVLHRPAVVRLFACK